jgi:hypothetical protein
MGGIVILSNAPGCKVTAVTITSVSIEPGQAVPRSGGWNAGDKVIVKGSGFTRQDNEVYATDGQSESLLARADSLDGSELTFRLPEGFYAPFGTGLRIKNANGSGSNVPAGERRTF